MAKSSNLPIREVCSLLGVKPHVLRYWEREIPLLSPKKTVSGHRSYSRADLEILFRIRHLLNDKGFTLAGVKKKLWAETAADYQDAKAKISEIRSELIDLSKRVSSVGKKLDPKGRT